MPQKHSVVYRSPSGLCAARGKDQEGCIWYEESGWVGRSEGDRPCHHCTGKMHCQFEGVKNGQTYGAGGKVFQGPPGPLVIYHSADNDGLASAAVVHASHDDFLYGGEPADVEFVPWNYDDPVPEFGARMAGRRVYVLDVSLPPEAMLELAAAHERGDIALAWIDHHDDADELARRHEYDWVPGMRSRRHDLTGRPLSAAEMAAAYFLGRVPRAVELVSKYDTFRRDEDWERATLPFQYGIRSLLPRAGGRNDQIAEFSRYYIQYESDSVLKAIAEGAPVLRYVEGVCRRAIATGVPLDLLGQRAIAVNAGWFGSLVFDYLPKGHGYDLGVTYSFGHLGWRWNAYALRGGADASAAAREFGGGGRPQAAGWSGVNPALLLGAHGGRRDALDLVADALRSAKSGEGATVTLNIAPPGEDGSIHGTWHALLGPVAALRRAAADFRVDSPGFRVSNVRETEPEKGENGG
jgi:hypothetical protein